MQNKNNSNNNISQKNNPRAKPLNMGKAAARVAAVQALYMMDSSGTDILTVISDFENYFVPQEVDDFSLQKVNAGLFRDILQGVLNHQHELDKLIDDTLPTEWPLTRIDMTLRAILRCGAYEIVKRMDIPPKVSITEYVEVTRDFFDNKDEIRLTNGVLDKIAHTMRAVDLNPTVFG